MIEGSADGHEGADGRDHRDSQDSRDRRTVVTGVVALLVAFAAGMGAGTLLTEDAERAPSTPPPALFDGLGLTAEQEAHVDSVLAVTEERTAALLEETRLDLTARATDALEAIDRALTPEQIDTVRARIRRWEPPGVARPAPREEGERRTGGGPSP